MDDVKKQKMLVLVMLAAVSLKMEYVYNVLKDFTLDKTKNARLFHLHVLTLTFLHKFAEAVIQDMYLMISLSVLKHLFKMLLMQVVMNSKMELV